MPADYGSAAQSLIQGIGGLVAGQQTASADAKAAAFYGRAAQYSELQTGIKEQMATRQIYQTEGAAQAAIGASGLKEGGSAADIMRSSAQQGSLTKALVQAQGDIETMSYTAQQVAATGAASSAKTSGTFAMIGGVASMLGSLFSDDTLKTDIELVRRRDDGIGIYTFRFKNGGPLFEGVLASEVEKLRPDAVQYDDMGTRRIDYDAINAEFHQVGSAA